MRLISTVVVLLWALGGCTTTKLTSCAADLKADLRQPPAECVRQCDPLTPPAGATLADTYQAAMGAALNQKECARRHRCLVEWAAGK